MRLLIVEDEDLIAQRLERMSREIIGHRLQHLAVLPTLEAAQLHLQEMAVDLILLDLNLNGKNGFQLLQQFTAQSFHTIIVSAYTEKAIEAYEFGVLDFVPKPFDLARLTKAYDRFFDADYRSLYPTRYLACKCRGRLDLIRVSEILYCQGADHYARLFLRNGEEKLYDKSLQQLLPLLPASFVRVHKSYIVNLDEASALQVRGGGRYFFEMPNEEEVPVSRSGYKLLKSHLAR
ncbi:MAG: LytTR family DNA-binding domain-containing protein [Saprospiraceae bacterium]|nr:LytTR family DNA-binding domain-containing protein [Saprospiraceae bacterium]